MLFFVVSVVMLLNESVVSVCSNNIGDTGADFIRQALDYNTTLKFIECVTKKNSFMEDKVA